MEIAIKNVAGRVLYEHGEPENTLRRTVTRALKAGIELPGADFSGEDLSGTLFSRANLHGASFCGATLRGASFEGARLDYADFRNADLADANLDRCNLRYAYFMGANLFGAYLGRADFAGASLTDARVDEGLKLVGGRPILQIGPIGSRSEPLICFLTGQGVRFSTGCFFGTRDEFMNCLVQRYTEEGQADRYAHEYCAAITLIDKHAELWTPLPENNPEPVPLTTLPTKKLEMK
ncbi:MAG: pentapeptide repeat-containing protein [Candidatus Accumulibacter sp.]|jgi:uncharacterized protein YjbI with pentapeptide repeats|nr:pentapeptide repeat-containing protein [Accumulibacter sp.]